MIKRRNISDRLTCGGCFSHYKNGGECREHSYKEPCSSYSKFEAYTHDSKAEKKDTLINLTINAMMKKLNANDHKAGFLIPIDDAYGFLCDKIEKLRAAILSGNQEDIINQCANVANYAGIIIYIVNYNISKRESEK
jgi:hypothetical protein